MRTAKIAHCRSDIRTVQIKRSAVVVTVIENNKKKASQDRND